MHTSVPDPTSHTPAPVAELRGSVRGQVITPGEEDYDEAFRWYAHGAAASSARTRSRMRGRSARRSPGEPLRAASAARAASTQPSPVRSRWRADRYPSSTALSGSPSRGSAAATIVHALHRVLLSERRQKKDQLPEPAIRNGVVLVRSPAVPLTVTRRTGRKRTSWGVSRHATPPRRKYRLRPRPFTCKKALLSGACRRPFG